MVTIVVAVRNILSLLVMLLLFLFFYNRKAPDLFFDTAPARASASRAHPLYFFEDTVKIRNYFRVMDGIVYRYDSLLTYPVSEHLIIRNNPWVIDSLAATDYYGLKERGITNLDPGELPIFKPGQYLVIPDSTTVDSLNRLFEQTWLDINVPEFKLRVRREDSLINEFPVRVGRNERKYLAMAGRIVDLRTHTGEGTILRHIKNPDFINPVDNHLYQVTQRDDGVTTRLPKIPWLEPEINGLRYGQLIHPTTNIETLGKASSNGCIGTSEAAAWYLYYYAPLGTRIVIRNDPEVVDKNGNTKRIQKIYDR